MMTLFKDKPVLAEVASAAVIIFFTLSFVNLYYSIKVNRAQLDKLRNS